jgi:gluconokinase
MVIVVTGPAGSGKSYIGARLALALGCPFVEGDAFHPPGNVARMRAGIPLTDVDRAPWLAALAAEIRAHLDGSGCVVACSALKRRYRRALTPAQHPEAVRFVYLRAEPGLLRARVAARPDHFFPEELLSSQLADLEPPEGGEPVLVVDAADPPDRVVEEIIRGLGLRRPAG